MGVNDFFSPGCRSSPPSPFWRMLRKQGRGPRFGPQNDDVTSDDDTRMMIKARHEFTRKRDRITGDRDKLARP